MKKVSPYLIQHIDLAALKDAMVFSLLKESGYYLVFWWKEIPLGHIFLESGEHPAKEVLFQKLFKAIKPALDFYAGEKDLAAPAYQEAFFMDYNKSFIHEMDRIFSGYLPDQLPETVDVSIVICTRNRSRDLKNCLEQLQSQRSLPREIIVVDNAPDDDSSQTVVAGYPGTIYYREPRPGLDIARNTGAENAKSSIVAYVDDDVLVHSLWAYRIWQSFSTENIVAVTGLVIAAELETEAQQIFEKFWSFNRGYEDKIYDSSYYQTNLADGPPVWEIGAGANMAFRKSVFKEIGYFDERLDVGAAGCSGDSEMWYRILAKGGTILYSPRAVVYHKHRKELRQLHKQLYSYMRGFAAAALIQQDQDHRAGYKKRLFLKLPKSYCSLLLKAFPDYSFQNRTLLSEIRGVLSGVIFYYRNKKTSNSAL